MTLYCVRSTINDTPPPWQMAWSTLLFINGCWMSVCPTSSQQMLVFGPSFGDRGPTPITTSFVELLRLIERSTLSVALTSDQIVDNNICRHSFVVSACDWCWRIAPKQYYRELEQETTPIGWTFGGGGPWNLPKFEKNKSLFISNPAWEKVPFII